MTRAEAEYAGRADSKTSQQAVCSSIDSLDVVSVCSLDEDVPLQVEEIQGRAGASHSEGPSALRGPTETLLEKGAEVDGKSARPGLASFLRTTLGTTCVLEDRPSIADEHNKWASKASFSAVGNSGLPFSCAICVGEETLQLDPWGLEGSCGGSVC